MEGFTLHYLQKLTVCYYWIIMEPTQRSVDNFGFSIVQKLFLERETVAFWPPLFGYHPSLFAC